MEKSKTREQILEAALDTVVETVLKGYADHSIFVRADWDNPEFTKDKTGMTAEDVAKLIQGQMRYILHDTHISKGRKLLMIEQFRKCLHDEGYLSGLPWRSG